MPEYTFVLKYRLAAGDCDAEAIIERLGEAGCTDATIGIGVAGKIALDFTRDGANARGVIDSALADVRAAIPTAALIEVLPDIVGLSDIADLMGVTRQSMRKLMVGHDDFPPPIYEGSVALWHLVDVLAWLDGRSGYTFDHALLETATAARRLNKAARLAWRRTLAHRRSRAWVAA